MRVHRAECWGQVGLVGYIGEQRGIVFPEEEHGPKGTERGSFVAFGVVAVFGF